MMILRVTSPLKGHKRGTCCIIPLTHTTKSIAECVCLLLHKDNHDFFIFLEKKIIFFHLGLTKKLPRWSHCKHFKLEYIKLKFF